MLFTENVKTPVPKIPSMFTKSPKSKNADNTSLSPDEKAVIEADTLNEKLWDECLEVFKKQGKQVFKDFNQYQWST